MARELYCSFNAAAANLYVIIRNTADGTVWSVAATAFATWANGSIDDYDVALTDDGGDEYYGTFPTAITAGDYRLFFYTRAGATPAITDTLLKTEVRHWDGTAMSSGSSVSLSAYALSDLDSVKRRLEITDSDSDTLLTEYLNQVSLLIERVTGVNFKARDYRLWLDGANQREIVLPYFPVQHVTRVSFGAAQAMSLTYTGSAIRANASIYKDPESADAGGLRLVSVSTTGVKTANNLSFATYGSVTALVTAVNLISGWAGTTIQNVPTLDLHPTGGEDAKGRSVFLMYPDQDDYTYSVNAKSGLLRFDRYGSGNWPFWGWYGHSGGAGGAYALDGDARMPRGFQHVLVELRAGYETIPADVSLVCNEIVCDKFFEGQTGRGVVEQKIGPYLLKLDQSEIDDIRTQLKDYIDHSQLIGGSR